MTYSFWLEQTVAVSRWLDASAQIGATSLDRSPGVFIGGGAPAPKNDAAKGPRILVMLDKFSTM